MCLLWTLPADLLGDGLTSPSEAFGAFSLFAICNLFIHFVYSNRAHTLEHTRFFIEFVPNVSPYVD